MPERSLITGASGFVGSYLTRRLIEQGDEVAILARSTSDLWRLAPYESQLIKIEASLDTIGQAAAAIEAFAPTRVFHLAWTGGNSARFNDDLAQVYANIPGSLALLRLASKAGATMFLNLGSCVEYGKFRVPVRETDPVEPTNLYGAAKHAFEDLALRMAPALNLRFASARLFWSYGPGDDDARLIPALTRKLLANQRHAMTPGTQLWDFLYIADVIDALLAIAGTSTASGVFNLGSGQPRPLREVAELLHSLTHSTAELGFGEIPFGPNQIMHLEADTTRLREATGWQPRVSLEQGMQQTVDWYRSGSKSLS